MLYSRLEPANMTKSRREFMSESAATLIALSNASSINNINQSEQNVLWGQYLKDHTNNAVTSISASEEPIGTRWRIGNSEYPPYPTVRGQIIYVNRGERISAIDKITGDSIWNYPAESLVLAPAIDSERIYFGTTEGKIVCLDRNGNRNWEQDVGAFLGPCTIYDDRIYFAGGSQLYSFNKDGSGYQSVDIGDVEQPGFLCIGDSHAYIYRSFTTGGSLSKVNIETGSIDTVRLGPYSDAPVYFDNTIIMTGRYDTGAVSAGSLDTLWTQNASIQVPPVASDNQVIIPLSDAVLAHDIQTGEQVWEYPYNRDSGNPAATIAGDDLVMSYGGVIQNIDAAQGLGNWDYEFSSDTSRSTHQIVPLDDGYLVTYGNELYMLETERTVQTPTDVPRPDDRITDSEIGTNGGQGNDDTPDIFNPIRWFLGLEQLSQVATIVTAILTTFLTGITYLMLKKQD